VTRFKASSFSSEELEWISKKNLENMLVNFRNELLKIHRTGECPLSMNTRKKLRDYGLIDFGKKQDGIWHLTARCLKQLELVGQPIE
jgi:hypothetical protein